MVILVLIIRTGRREKWGGDKMAFIAMKDGSYLNTNCVTSLRPTKAGVKACVNYENWLDLAYNDIDEVVSHCATIVPALPGWRLALVIADGKNKYYVGYADIIAWALTSPNDKPIPICANGDHKNGNLKAIVDTVGAFDDENGTYAGSAEWLAHLKDSGRIGQRRTPRAKSAPSFPPETQDQNGNAKP